MEIADCVKVQHHALLAQHALSTVLVKLDDKNNKTETTGVDNVPFHTLRVVCAVSSDADREQIDAQS